MSHNEKNNQPINIDLELMHKLELAEKGIKSYYNCIHISVSYIDETIHIKIHIHIYVCVCMHMRGSIIHNSLTVETIQMSIN